ncbi:MAG: RHS repeat protein [Acidobacteriaceae bacterium]|nr:RHS repeat protein [Acidobacteriaceae bacterium]
MIAAINKAGAQLPFATPSSGVNPYLSYSGGSIDHIQMQNGSLNIRIPLISYPQLGKLSLSFSAVVNSRHWTETVACYGDDMCDYKWEDLGPSPSVQLVADQDLSITGGNGGGMFSYSYTPVGSPTDALISWDKSYTIYGIYDATGATRPLANDLSALNTLQSMDGSGYVLRLPLLTPTTASIAAAMTTPCTGMPTPCATDTVITEPNGIRHIMHGQSTNVVVTISDPMNNQIKRYDTNNTFAAYVKGDSLPIVDSMGRTIPQLPFPNYPNIYTPEPDTAACPDLHIPNEPVVYSYSWNPPGANGLPLAYHFCYTSVQIATDFTGAGKLGQYYNYINGDIVDEYIELQSIVLPDRTYWGFIYQTAVTNDGGVTFDQASYGEITGLILPSGGKISYESTFIPECHQGKVAYSGRGIKKRIADPQSGQPIETTYYQYNASNNGKVGTSIETDAKGNDVVYEYTRNNDNVGSCGSYESAVKWYSGSSSSGAVPIKEIDTKYTSVPDPTFDALHTTSIVENVNTLPQTRTTKINGQVIKTEIFDYEKLFTAVQPILQVGPGGSVGPTGNYEPQLSGYLGSTSDIRFGNPSSYSDGISSTTTIRMGTHNPAYASAGFLFLPYSVTTTDLAGKSPAKTTIYGYDENGSPTGIFGNQTSINEAGVITSIKYNNYGVPCEEIDAKGNHTSFYYAGTTPNGDSAGCAAAAVASPYLTSVQRSTTNGIVHITSVNHEFYTGRVSSITDENGNTTSYGYDDINHNNRLVSVNYPDGGEVNQCYTDTGGSTCSTALSPPYQMIVTTKANPNPEMVKQTTFDGLGRILQTAISPGKPTAAYTDYTYDSLGRLESVSNPYHSSFDSTYGKTTYTYDALGRKIIQDNPALRESNNALIGSTNKSFQQWCYNGMKSSDRQNNCLPSKGGQGVSWIDYSDEKGNHKQLISDGRDRLIAVWEPDGNGDPSVPAVQTRYMYDMLDNLVDVNQLGKSGDAPRHRTFTYDSLSRLLCASNPENSKANCPDASNYYGYIAGTTGYMYDPNGNVQQKTDSRGVNTCYTYDSLNRTIRKGYSDGQTPTTFYQYDSSNVQGAAGNLISQLTNAWTEKAGTSCTGSGKSFVSSTGQYLTAKSILAYDSMGRVKKEQQCHGSKCTAVTPYISTTDYDLIGNPIDFWSNVYGIEFSRSYDSEGHLKVMGSLLPNSYIL